MQTFTELPIASALKDNLARARFVAPTAIQAGAIPPALDGKDVLGTAQTGTGKTLAFAVPMLDDLLRTHGRGVQGLILVPTRELAMQVQEMIRLVSMRTGIMTALVVGGLSESRQLADIQRGARIIIATPGRLEDYVKRKLVNLQGVRILVLDEADRMVDMGFLPQMKTIMRELPLKRQTMCFSATLDRSVSHLVHDYLKNPVRVAIGDLSTPTDQISLSYYQTSREQKFPLLAHLLKTEPGTFLIFARTKYGADKLASRLKRGGFDAAAIHGGRSQSQRTRALQGFKQKMPRVLVATDVAARGIHVQGIAHVVNFDLPQTPDDFIHRVGRTGRHDASGSATAFVMREDLSMLRAIEHKLGKPLKQSPLPEGLVADLPQPREEYHPATSRRFTHAASSRPHRALSRSGPSQFGRYRR